MSKKTKVLNYNSLDSTQKINFFNLVNIIGRAKHTYDKRSKFELSRCKEHNKSKAIDSKATSIDSLLLNGGNKE